MGRHPIIASIPDWEPVVQPWAISRRKQNFVIGRYRDVFKESPGSLRLYQAPNGFLVSCVGDRVATVLRRVTLAVMRIKGDPEALAEKQVRVGQKSKKSS